MGAYGAAAEPENRVVDAAFLQQQIHPYARELATLPNREDQIGVLHPCEQCVGQYP